MWIYNDDRAFAPEFRQSTANGSPKWRLSWNDAWIAIRDAIRPFPDAARALLPLVERLLDECRAFGDPARQP